MIKRKQLRKAPELSFLGFLPQNLWFLFSICGQKKTNKKLRILLRRQSKPKWQYANTLVTLSWPPRLCSGLLYKVKKSQFNFHPACFHPHRHQREWWSIHCTWLSLSRLMSPSVQGPLNQRTTFVSPPSVSPRLLSHIKVWFTHF